MKKSLLPCLAVLLLSLAALEAGLFYALYWYWSGFEWSPLGYETCGLEIIVFPMLIYPAFVIGLLLRLLPFFRRRMPRYCLYLPLLLCAVCSCALAKTLEMGVLCIASMIVLAALDILGFVRAWHMEPPSPGQDFSDRVL